MRIIAATHRDLRTAVRQGLFREDLYYRLNVVPLRIPPLRERSEDIPELVAHFLAQAHDDALPAKTIEPQAIERLQRYRWPGNVRELENLIRRLVALYSQQIIDVRTIETELADTTATAQPDSAAESHSLRGLGRAPIADLFFGKVTAACRSPDCMAARFANSKNR